MKLNDTEFWTVIEAAGGIYSSAVEIIKKNFPEEKHMTRQAVRQRCLKSPDRYDEIREHHVDIAEAAILNIIGDKDHKEHAKTARWFVETRGKTRGYHKKTEITGDQTVTISFDED